MKKLLAILSLTATLASCSVMDIVGPRANAELMKLAKQARADSLALNNDPEVGALRASQSKALAAEAQRLCGTDPAGATPPSCNVAIDDADLPAGASGVDLLIEQLRSSTVAAADAVPPDSVDLVIAQAVDVVALDSAVLDRVSVDETALADSADYAAASAMLTAEFELEYGLSLATAFADEALSERITAQREASDQRRELLVAALEPLGDVPGYQAGYEIANGADPTDAASATEFVEHLETTNVARWIDCVSLANNDEWRTVAINFAAQAQHQSHRPLDVVTQS